MHRKYQTHPGEDIPMATIAGNWSDTILLERRRLAVSMDLYPEGTKKILYHAYFYSGIPNGIVLFMDDLRVHMHHFLSTFYGVETVCFRFIHKEMFLNVVNEKDTLIQEYLDSNNVVKVHVWK